MLTDYFYQTIISTQVAGRRFCFALVWGSSFGGGSVVRWFYFFSVVNMLWIFDVIPIAQKNWACSSLLCDDKGVTVRNKGHIFCTDITCLLFHEVPKALSFGFKVVAFLQLNSYRCWCAALCLWGILDSYTTIQAIIVKLLWGFFFQLKYCEMEFGKVFFSFFWEARS